MPKCLEMTADKFTFRVATDRLYTPEGVWILPEPGSTRVRVGLADYLRQHNGDVAFANVKPVGSKLAAGEQFAEIETIKAMLDLHAPISGVIVEVNTALMNRTTTYNTTVRWTGEHWGHLVMGNGPEMKFSAPPDAHGHAGVFTPEDAFVAAANTCVMMMFIWAAERFKLKLLSYECRTEGTKLIELDRTEIFSRLIFRPVIRLAAAGEPRAIIEARTRRALQAAQKYSLVANSVKSEIVIEPEITIEQ